MMRVTLSLFVASLGLAAASAVVCWREAPSEDGDLAARAARATADFRRASSPRAKLSVASLLGGRADLELLDPARTLPHFHGYDRKEIDALDRYARGCRGGRARPTGPLAKAWAWHAHLCGGKLAPGFLDLAPWMHPSGRSYVRLAFEAGALSREALERRQHGLHVLEAAALGLAGPRSEVPGLTRSALRSILAEEPLVIEAGQVLLGRKKGTDAIGSLEYESYERSVWDRFLSSRGLAAAEGGRPGCLLREGNACWSLDPEGAAPRMRWLASVVFTTSIGLALGAAWLAWRRLQAGREERRRRQFLLRMLAHEFRTPVTALQLTLESLRRDFDRLTPPAQVGFLRASEQVSRLGRLIEASRGYLSDEGFQLNRVAVPSLRAFLEGALAEHEGRFTLDCEERPARLDTYWTALCVRNLVENALLHGRPPVVLRVEEAAGRLSILVEDAGPGPARGLRVDSLPKAEGSPGLGLGLGIVRTVARAMGGDLNFRTSPTTFVLSFAAEAWSPAEGAP